MSLDLTDLAKSLGTFLIGSAFFTWITQAVFKSFFDAGLARHRASLERENSEAVERLKSELATIAQRTQAQLQHENSQAAERLKVELGTVAHEVQARSSALIAKQGEVIAEMYTRLIDAEERCEGPLCQRW